MSYLSRQYLLSNISLVLILYPITLPIASEIKNDLNETGSVMMVLIDIDYEKIKNIIKRLKMLVF